MKDLNFERLSELANEFEKLSRSFIERERRKKEECIRLQKNIKRSYICENALRKIGSWK
ncbi:MAG: hypothetical protein ACR5KV_04075 [Wolbachia sp.]